MALFRNYVEDFDVEAKGMDSTTPLASMRPGYVREAWNCNLGLVSGYIKRNGYSTVLDTPISSDNITGGIEYRLSAGTRRVVVFTSSGTLQYVSNAGGGSATSITTGLDTDARPSFIQFGDQLFFFNGTDNPVVYDGSSTKQYGITAPSSAPTESAQGTAGSLTQTASYIYAYTYYNSTTGAESSPSALLSVTLTGSNDDVTLGLSAGDSSTADKIRIWRTVADGNELFLVTSIAIGSTSHNDTTADSSLGRPIEMDNSRLADLTTNKGNYPVVASNRVFVVTGENEVRWSKIGYRGAKPESFEAKAISDTQGTYGNADGIVGLNAVGAQPIVLKRRSIGRMDPVGFEDYDLVSDNQLWIYKEISNEVGAVSHHAAVQIEGELLFLSRDNIYRTDGQRVTPAANEIASTIRSLSFTDTQIKKLSAINDRRNKRAYWQVFKSSGDTVPNWTLVCDYQRYPELRWTIYRPGTTASTHPSWRVGCFIPVTSTSDGASDIWAGNLDANGELFLMNDGTNDNTKAIYYKVITRPYDFKRASNVKLYKKSFIDAQGNGNDYDLRVGSIFNLSESEEKLADFSLAVSGAKWDVAEWDVAEWGTNEIIRISYDTHKKARYRQLVFLNTAADEPVTVFNWTDSASLFNPR